MRVLMFQPRFARLVEVGTKRHTIRKAARCKPGDTLSLREWSGKPYRSKQRVIRTETCTKVEPVTLALGGSVVGGRVLTFEEEEKLAMGDGFRDPVSMLVWFEQVHGLPFGGEIIHW